MTLDLAAWTASGRAHPDEGPKDTQGESKGDTTTDTTTVEHFNLTDEKLCFLKSEYRQITVSSKKRRNVSFVNLQNEHVLKFLRFSFTERLVTVN